MVNCSIIRWSRTSRRARVVLYSFPRHGYVRQPTDPLGFSMLGKGILLLPRNPPTPRVPAIQ
jgi:hypothetical protein